MQAGEFATGDKVWLVHVGAPITTADDARRVVVAVRNGAPVYLAGVASVSEGPAERELYVDQVDRAGAEPAVTLALAKRPGANATHVAEQVIARVDAARGRLVPERVQVDVTRNYGATAADKASELILHLLIATLSVTALIWVFLGFREALVVLVAVPVTLALTLFTYYILGYTLNRVTLFALIFSIGILVDDAIVVVENIYRHLAKGGVTPETAAIEGVDEVGNPTILATFTVIAAILPMAFVSGMTGPYMRPIPVGASAAMLASLAVAFIITPCLALWLLRGHVKPDPTDHDQPEVAPDGWYARLMRVLLTSPKRRVMVYAGTGLLLLASMTLVGLRLVQLKMLPFDNKNEFQVVLDLPEGTTLETTHAAAKAIAVALRQVPEVQSTQVYAGTSAPFNFNGLVRHYFLRRGANVADVQVNLAAKGDRHRQSHAIAISVRPMVDSIARQFGARAKIAEIPPGPPVLSTLVAEVYGPSDSVRRLAAEQVRRVMESTPGVVDVDWSLEAPEGRLALRIDRALAGGAGVGVDQVTQVLTIGLTGMAVGQLSRPLSSEPVAITERLPLVRRSSLGALLALPVATPGGPMPLGRFVRVDTTARESSREQKNLRPTIYVTADVAGSIESPVYAIMAMNHALDSVRINGAEIRRYNAVQPERLDEVAIKWDGEWQVTIEVFRDLGLAFAVVLLLIYLLVVGWFQSYTIPLVIMAPIPLTLIGILPGHAIMGAFFTATSMVGMIALAGITVRNSILLVDFIQLAEARGSTLADAVIEAGTVRFRPIALTAAAVVTGGLVMVLDPIFQGLAVSLMSGAVVATALTMVIVPMLYWELRRRRREVTS
jgi:multidrug efflux pump subunit AcrB